MNRYFSPMRFCLMVLLATLPMILPAENSPTAGTLVCTNQINVSANSNCALDITVDHLLISDSDPGPYELEIELGNGQNIDFADVSRYINETFKYTITNTSTNNYCWGYITIEDKIAPTVICDSCTDPVVTDPDCILSCTEYPLFAHNDLITGQSGYDKDLLDKIIPTDIDDFIRDKVTDNCNQPFDVYYRDVLSTPSCTADVLLSRTWTVEYELPDGTISREQCIRYYKFETIDVYDGAGDPIIIEGDGTATEDVIFMPEKNVTVTLCGNGYSPFEIAAYFDNPLTQDYDSDDDGIDPDEGDVDCVIENNEGIWHAFPHYYAVGLKNNNLHAQPVTENICTVNAYYSDLVFDACGADCTGNVKVARTWTILDWCSNTFFEYKQTIDIVDKVPPVLEVEDVFASVDPWHCAATAKIPAPAALYDECDGGVTYSVELFSYLAEITGSAEDGYVIHDLPRGIYQLIYIAEDCCGNLNSKTVEFLIDDRTAPVPVVIENIVVDLVPTGIIGEPDRGIAKLYARDIDNGSFDGCSGIEVSVRRSYVCSPADTVWGDFVQFCCADLAGVESTEIEVEFRVMDWNGNVNYIQSTVLLEDKGISSTCPSDRVITCDDDIWDFDITGYPTAQSSCADIPIIIDTVKTFEKTEPRKKRENEGAVPGYIGVEVEAYDPACGFGAMRRQWQNQSGSTFCTQWFVIEPGDYIFDPTTIKFPEDVTVFCTDYDTGKPTWVDGSCNLIGVDLDSDTIRTEANACMTILNHWSVINWCTYDASDTDLNDIFDDQDDGVVRGRYSHYQTILIVDNTYPIVVSEEDKVIPVDENCEGKGVTLDAIATDVGDCASPWLAWTIRIDLQANGLVEYIYSNNTAITINGEPNPYFLPKTASGDQISITLPDVIESSKKRHRVDWLVSDGCNNQTIYTSYFTVEDTKAPTPYCLNLGTTVMENGQVELWAIDFNVGSFDNCTAEDELFFTFTDVPPPPRCDEEFDSQTDLQWYDGTYWFYDSSEPTVDDDRDCPIDGEGAYDDGGYNPATRAFEGYGGDIHRWEPGLRSSGKVFTIDDVDTNQFLELPMYTWDGCHNIDFCLVHLRIIDNGGGAQGTVAGVVKTEANEVVENVMTTLITDLPDYPKYEMTDNTGTYAFEENTLAMDYQLSASKDDDYLNGVSTIDLVKIQRHILGIEQLDSPYKMIAADVNDDEIINGLDLIELRKLILGIYTELPQNESWKILSKKSQLSLANPWSYDMTISILDIVDNMMDQDFIGVKIGDVDDSVVAHSRTSEKPTSGVNNLSYSDRLVTKGEEFQIAFNTDNPLVGYQIGMTVSNLDILNVEGESISATDFRVRENNLDLSCSPVHDLEGQLFTLTVVAQESGQLSEMISLNNQLIKAESYLGENLEVREVNLVINNDAFITIDRNVPNPFKTETLLNYTLKQDADIEVTFYDVTGRLLKTMTDQGKQGTNSVKVTNESLGTGLVYYKITSDKFYAINNMLIVN